MSTQIQFRLPDPVEICHWPWPRMLNPHYAEVKAECVAWIHSFNAMSPKAQKAFDKCDFSLLASLIYPSLDRQHLRTGCDLMMLFFVFDEFTDKEDGKGVRKYVDIVVDAIEHPDRPRPAGEHVLGEITRQFWERAIQTASAASQRHFVRTFKEYAEAVIEEASDRVSDRVRSIDDYLALRRLTAGPYPGFFPCEVRVDLPDDVFYHPSVANLTRLVAESVVVTNDTYSYNIEQAAGHQGHNIVTVVMREKHLSLPQAFEWVGNYHAGILTEFLESRQKLPSFGAELDAQVADYVEGLAHGVRGLDNWCFESGRYFGSKGLEVQKHRTVGLLPKVVQHEIATPMMALPVSDLDKMEEGEPELEKNQSAGWRYFDCFSCLSGRWMYL
ncbi:terpenoid synthase [Auriscalpium vulgare]|uniref:Terpenoid synthase n=1 Tax=Auriscalpium vulgare TaxID=40419 RepID=A0ACB8S843_9AGAM|nr:terpenoid synthase [Auriscalpium vulgare]